MNACSCPDPCMSHSRLDRMDGRGAPLPEPRGPASWGPWRASLTIFALMLGLYMLGAWVYLG